ncbi:tripartite tricarboxylate transporter permease [Halalkalibacter oceani]|uniref:Tripartite tricarboxylate transporter permease n=1 Tax=Halalkalibacter oceani TaxID=1653776 RepID=A0A9X2DUN9_9BACI|nr:tripartite tricarboxylate transporter permease [Halalkalibacter oceani]MCM3715735.1 tripartite tricarboxylate transporter permease [Halalkalibacter oceani]
MEGISELIVSGFLNSITPYHIFLMMISLVGGIIVGTLPGLTAVMGVTLMMPFTLAMEPATGLVMLGAIYCGAIYGGANSAILLNIPGTPSAIATTFDGYPLTEKGRASEALFGSLLASVIGGVIGVIILMLFFAPLAQFGLRFGAPEYFWLAIFGLTTIAAMSPGNILKGLLGGSIGLLISTIGINPFTGTSRFTFGMSSMSLGIDMVAAMVGLFSIGQMLILMESNEKFVAKFKQAPRVVQKVFQKFVKDCKVILLRSSIIGTFIGMLPGAGGAISSLIAYNESRRWDKNPEKYGTGAMEGIATAESANNAQVGGSLIPMLGLGIPGSAVAAVLMGGLLAHGIQPGTLLLSQSGDIAYTFIMSLLVANILMLVVGYFMIKMTARVLMVPRMAIVPTVIALSVIGAFAVRGQMFDVKVMIIAGIIGYLLMKVNVPLGPIALGIILGPIAEDNLGVSMMLAKTQASIWHVLVLRPISLILIILCILAVVTPLILDWKDKLKAKKETTVLSKGEELK